MEADSLCHIDEFKSLKDSFVASIRSSDNPSQDDLDKILSSLLVYQKYFDEMVSIAYAVKDLPASWDEVSNPSATASLAS